MKIIYFFFCIFFLPQNHSQVAVNQPDTPPDLSKVSLACITATQLIKATASACNQKENLELWQDIIDCHRPMTDQFMRQTAEAKCPMIKRVEDPTDKRFSIQEVFYNICGLVEGNSTQRNKGMNCLIKGQFCPYVMNHELEVFIVKLLFGRNVPCNIGKCVLDLGLGV